MNPKSKIIGFCGGFFDISGVGKTTAANTLVEKYNFHLCHIGDNIEKIAKKTTQWDGIKDKKGIEILSKICIEGRTINQNYWINLALASIPENKNRIVFDDISFTNEYNIIKNMAGILILIQRTGFSQPEWDFTPDHILNNNSTIEDFTKNTCTLVENLL